MNRIWLLVKEPLKRGLMTLAALMFMAVPGPAAAREIDYAILPGIAVGAIALGTPENVAAQAIKRYGTVVSDPTGTCAISGDAVICYTLSDGKVAGAAAAGPGWYVVTESGPLYLGQAGVREILAAFGEPDCIALDFGIWDDLGLLIGLDDFGNLGVAGVTGRSVCED